jgi:4-hydroxy-2-oxoheptanedioate aldolase
MSPVGSSVSSLSEALRGKESLMSAWCSLPDPTIAGLLARENFDAVILDMQHGLIDYSGVVAAIPLVAAAGKPAIARVPVGDFAAASRFLDAGAAGVIAPMINTIEDARLFASFMKYPPMGERSWGPHGVIPLTGMNPADYFREANGMSVSLAMIETREALHIVDDILAVAGIDGIFIGPADLSIALSGGARVDAHGREVDEALAHCLARARAAGKFVGVFAIDGERARTLVERGFDLVSLGTDTTLLRAGAQAAIKVMRGA